MGALTVLHSVAPSADAAAVARRRVTRLAGSMVGLLVVQNALGIYVNLFVNLAIPSSIATVFPVIFSNPVLIVHGLVAWLLIGAAAAEIAVGGRTGDRWIRPLAIAAVLVLALTAYLGYHFVATQDNAYSFGMEMGFLTVLLLNVAILARVARAEPEPAAPAAAAPA